MKRKQTNTTPKAVKVAKTPMKKGKPVKVVHEEVEESEEEQEVPRVEVVKKAINKKTPGKPKKVVEEVPEDDEEVSEDEQQEDEDDEGDEEDEEAEEVEEDEQAEEEVEETEDVDEAEEAEDDDDDDDDAPSEEDIGTEEPTIPSKVKSGPIDPSVSPSKMVRVAKLPSTCKQINIVEAFAKYGPLQQIHIVTTAAGTIADIVYKNESSAEAAAADDKKVKVLDTIVGIKRKRNSTKAQNMLSRDRSVHVKGFKQGTTEEQLKEHFKSCGEIEYVKLISKFAAPFAYVTFADKSSIPAALKLHNSILNDFNIKVNINSENSQRHTYDENLTITLKNKQDFKNIDVAKLQAIFSKCGEIDYIDLVCRGRILGFITFKTEEAAKKSLKLNGKTMQGIELEIELYSPLKKWTCVHVSNLSNDVNQTDLLKHFANAGEIISVVCKNNFAIIRFADSDGYCKSFLYNESFIKGQIIFIEPHSNRKQSVLKQKAGFKKGFKRPHENGHSVFKAKKVKSQ